MWCYGYNPKSHRQAKLRFIVLINYDGDYLVILDPSHGEYIASEFQFYSLWNKDKKSGYALIINPKLEFQREKINFPNKIFFEKF